MRLPVIACAAVLLAGCYDSSFDQPDEGNNTSPTTTTISELHRLYVGNTFPITGDVVVEGHVTSSDRAENFFRTICIEESQASLEVMAGIDQLYNDFPIGCRVLVHLKGLALGQSRGQLQLGRIPAASSGYTTDYLGSRAAVAAVVIRADEQLTAITPTLSTIRDLTPERCGNLVRIAQLRYAPEGVEEGNWSGYKRFTDTDGHVVYTYVRTYAAFATDQVPTEEVSLTGILQYDVSGEGRYLIKLRDAADCAL